MLRSISSDGRYTPLLRIIRDPPADPKLKMRYPLSAVIVLLVLSHTVAAQAEPFHQEPPQTRADTTAHHNPDPLENALFMLPTAHTPARGSVIFRDFQLVFLTLGYSPTSTTTIVIGGLFPIFTNFNVLTFGVKQGLYNNPQDGLAFAVNGNVSIPISSTIEGNNFVWYASGVASYRIAEAVGIHGSVGIIGAGSSHDSENIRNALIGAGLDWRLSRSIKFISEFWTGVTLFEDVNNVSLLNFGIRIHGEHLAADIAAMRPLGAGDSELFLIPLVTIGYRF